MTKRERDALNRKFERLEAKIAKKRDELRKLIEDFEPIINSANDGVDTMDSALAYLKDAREQIDYAADQLSQYV